LKNKVDQLNALLPTIRKSLTVIQFAVALFSDHDGHHPTINFVFEKDMGYEPSGLLYVSSPVIGPRNNRMLAAKKVQKYRCGTLSYEIPDGLVGQQSTILPQQGEEKRCNRRCAGG
jgi:hypothetical protein